MVEDKLNNEERDSEKKLLQTPKTIDNKIQTGGEKKKKSNENVTETRKDDETDGEDRNDDGEEVCGARKIFEKVTARVGINPNLVFLKITLFALYGATASLIPYLTVHMQSIGLTVEDIGIIYVLLPVTTFLAPPITGYLVDKMGNYKPVVIVSLILNLIFHHSLLFIPHQELPGVMPAAYVVRHPTNGIVEVWWSPCPSRDCPDEEELDMVLDDCVDYCLLQDDDSPKKPKKIPVMPSNIAVMPPSMINMKGPNSFSGVNFGDDSPKKQKPSNKVPVDKDGKAISQKNGQKPLNVNGTKEDLHFILGKNKTINQSKRVKPKKPQNLDPELAMMPKSDDDDDAAIFYIDMHPNLGDPKEQLGFEIEYSENVTDFRTRFGAELLTQAGVNVSALEEFDLRCGGIVLATNITYMKLNDLAIDCMLQKCNFIEGGPEICPPDYLESDDNIFWIYFALRFIGTTMLTGCVTILDPIALILIQRFGGQFGRERLFSSIGMAIFPPLTGVIIDSYSYSGYTDYRAAFYAYDILLLISIGAVAMMPAISSLPPDNILKDTLAIIKMSHVVFFIFFLFMLGNFWGFIESYLFLYLKELGARTTVTVGTLSSMPFLYGAERLTKKFGHVNIIVCAFCTHAIRLMGYSFIEEAWWCYPFEALEALAVHLMWIAAVTYCARLAPKNLIATVIGVIGMAHFSLGKGAGTFFGFIIIRIFGTRKAFRIMGITAVIFGLCYYLLHMFWLRKLKAVKELEEQADAEEREKLKAAECDEEAAKPTMKDVGVSAERLSLMIKFYHRGSLTSLDRSLASFHRSANLVKSNIDVNSRRRSTSSLFHKLSTPNLPRHNSLSRDKILKDSSTSCTPVLIKKSVETMTRYEDQSRPDQTAILEEEETTRSAQSSKGEIASLNTFTQT